MRHASVMHSLSLNVTFLLGSWIASSVDRFALIHPHFVEEGREKERRERRNLSALLDARSDPVIYRRRGRKYWENSRVSANGNGSGKQLGGEGERPNGTIGLSLNARKFCIIPPVLDRTFLAP